MTLDFRQVSLITSRAGRALGRAAGARAITPAAINRSRSFQRLGHHVRRQRGLPQVALGGDARQAIVSPSIIRTACSRQRFPAEKQALYRRSTGCRLGEVSKGITRGVQVAAG